VKNVNEVLQSVSSLHYTWRNKKKSHSLPSSGKDFNLRHPHYGAEMITNPLRRFFVSPMYGQKLALQKNLLVKVPSLQFCFHRLNLESVDPASKFLLDLPVPKR
jgi:hypothetical protein